jgi:hypothetical protein
LPPLVIVLVPILEHYYPMGIAVEQGSPRYLVTAGVTGAAALAGGLWLLRSSKSSEN